MVVGEDGKAVAGAEVEAIWSTERGGIPGVAARTDRSGTFTLHGIDPIAELSLTAWDGFASTPTVTIQPEAAAAPREAHHRPKHATPVAGRVVDSAGRPIAGSSVRVWRKVKDKPARDPHRPDRGRRRLPDAANRCRGAYRSRRRFPANASYYAVALAPGRLTARSPAIALGERSTKPPVLVLRRVGTLEGRVVNRQGQPLAGARIRQSGDGPMPTETLTAEDGRFRLPGVLEGPALLFAETKGYRSALVGCSVSPGSSDPPPVKITLAAHQRSSHRRVPDAPIRPANRRGASPGPPADRAPRGEGPRAGDDEQKYLFLRNAATIDAHSTIEWLDEAKFGDPDYADEVRSLLAAAIAGESLDEATALIEAPRAQRRGPTDTSGSWTSRRT